MQRWLTYSGIKAFSTSAPKGSRKKMSQHVERRGAGLGLDPAFMRVGACFATACSAVNPFTTHERSSFCEKTKRGE
jgi:hypothetical protein